MLNLNSEPELFESVYDNMARNINAIVANEQSNFTYQQIMDVIKTETRNASQSIEQRVNQYEQQIQDNIHQSAVDFLNRLAGGQVLM